MSDYFGLIVLDLACLLAAAAMLRAWRRRRTRPPLVAAGFLAALTIVATVLVVAGVGYKTVVLPTFVLALLVVLYTARYENKLAAPRR
jgi:uncharacterized SAM-binding protein YcdF (DUF218 family)